MIPELLPHPRHAVALEVKRDYETATRDRWPTSILYGVWKFKDQQVDEWLLRVCHRTRQMTDAEFRDVIRAWLNQWARLPLFSVVEADDRPAPFVERLPSWERSDDLGVY